jgi:iron-sulfur cluster repair protein YtfE (RIC family)
MSHDYQILPQESITACIQFVINVSHPSLRVKIAWLKKSFSKLIHLGGPNRQLWLSRYGLFFNLSSAIDQHMFHEETRLFPYLEAMEKKSGEIFNPGREYPLDYLVNEHKIIFQQWLALKEEIKEYEASPADKALEEGIRYDLIEFEGALKEHEDYEEKEIFEKAAKSGYLQGP